MATLQNHSVTRETHTINYVKYISERDDTNRKRRKHITNIYPHVCILWFKLPALSITACWIDFSLY